MKAWTRWEAWVTLVAGAYAALSTIWTSTTGKGGALAALIVLGVLMLLASLSSLARPGMVATEWATAVIGALLFIAPWVLGFTALAAASWTSWIVGAVGIVLGLLAVPESTRVHRTAAPSH